MSTTTPKILPDDFNTFYVNWHQKAVIDARTGFKRCEGLRFGQAFINQFWKEGDERDSILYNEENPRKAQAIITDKYIDFSAIPPIESPCGNCGYPEGLGCECGGE